MFFLPLLLPHILASQLWTPRFLASIAECKSLQLHLLKFAAEKKKNIIHVSVNTIYSTSVSIDVCCKGSRTLISTLIYIIFSLFLVPSSTSAAARASFITTTPSFSAPILLFQHRGEGEEWELSHHFGQVVAAAPRPPGELLVMTFPPSHLFFLFIKHLNINHEKGWACRNLLPWALCASGKKWEIMVFIFSLRLFLYGEQLCDIRRDTYRS